MAAIRRLSGARWSRVVEVGPFCVESLYPSVEVSTPVGQLDCFAASDFKLSSGRVEELGREDGFRSCHDGPLVPNVFCRFVGAAVAGHGSFHWKGFVAAARPPGIFIPIRGFAAKPKKGKSKVVNVEPTEEMGGAARANAIKLMETALDVLSKEHAKLRTGRPSAGMLDHITVEAHGMRTPLNHVAAVTVSGLQTLNVFPYDASMVKEVEKAILNSPMGLNPQVDGATLTVPLPRLTMEHCETMCKVVSKAGESAKLTIRRARKEALDSAKRSGDFSKDEMKRFEKEVEELTKKYNKASDEMCKNKENDLMV